MNIDKLATFIDSRSNPAFVRSMLVLHLTKCVDQTDQMNQKLRLSVGEVLPSSNPPPLNK